MKITNNHNVDHALYEAIKHWNSQYSLLGAGYSTTGIIKAPRQALLLKRHNDEAEIDVVDMVDLFQGIALHHAIHEAGIDNAFQEETFFDDIKTELGTRRLKGTIDCYRDHGLYDFKNTKAKSRLYKSSDKDYGLQLNINNRLMQKGQQGRWPVNSLAITFVYKDWSKYEAMKKGNYPHVSIETVGFPIMPEDEIEKYIHDRIRLLIECESLPDDDLPECTFEERWEKPTEWAVSRTGMMRSIVNIKTTEQDAIDRLQEEVEKNINKKKGTKHPKDAFYIEVRPGERTKCMSPAYCQVQRWCNQHDKHLESLGYPKGEDGRT